MTPAERDALVKRIGINAEYQVALLQDLKLGLLPKYVQAVDFAIAALAAQPSAGEEMAQIAATHNALMAESGHVCPSCGRGYSTESPPAASETVVVPSAMQIAGAIFAIGDEPNDKVQRIAFRGGKYPEGETDLGGLNRAALVNVIERAMLAASPGAQKGEA